MIVSISRELGAGGLTVGEAIAKTLGARLLDERTMIGILSERLGLSEEYVADRVERPQKITEGLLFDLAVEAAMFGYEPVYRPTDRELIVAARTLVAESARDGHVVVIGHGGPGLLRNVGRADKLMILLHAGRDWRIAEIAARFGIALDEARRRVERVDKARALYLERYFNVNMYAARDYDLVLNTEFLGLEQACAIACSVTNAVVAARA